MKNVELEEMLELMTYYNPGKMLHAAAVPNTEFQGYLLTEGYDGKTYTS